MTEENTVTTGSSIETSAAEEGPIFSKPLKNDQKASTVEISAIITTAEIPLMFCGAENPEVKFTIP